jgi:hypothetical protein
LDGCKQSRNIEGLEQDLGSRVAVGTRIERRFSQEDRVLFTQCLELFGVDVLPDLLHVVPVGDDAVFQRVADLEQTAQLLGFLTDKDVSFESAGQDAQVLGTTDVGWEITFGRVFASETRSDGAAAIVQHNRGVVECICHLTVLYDPSLAGQVIVAGPWFWEIAEGAVAVLVPDGR